MGEIWLQKYLFIIRRMAEKEGSTEDARGVREAGSDDSPEARIVSRYAQYVCIV